MSRIDAPTVDPLIFQVDAMVSLSRSARLLESVSCSLTPIDVLAALGILFEQVGGVFL